MCASVFLINLLLIVIVLFFQSAILGGCVGVVVMSWVSLNAQWAIASGAIRYQTKPLNVDQCSYSFNAAGLVSSAANATHLHGPSAE